MAPDAERLTVAVTGPTGTFGFGLVPLLEADPRIGEVVGIARRPFDPAEHGWSKMTYRQGDVRDLEGLTEAFAGADVVVHLAFLITGNAAPETIRAVNVDGTANAFAAAVAAGARRFVYASSAAAYGFHPDNPIGLREDWPVRPDRRLFYAEEKAEVEVLLADAAAEHPEVDCYLLRPPIVLGPHAMGGKDLLPRFLEPLAGRVIELAGAARAPVVIPALPVQFVHEDDVGDALLRCIVGDGPPGAYNVAGDGVLTAHDVARELGLTPLPFPVTWTQRIARALAAAPSPAFAPPVAEWIGAFSHPVVLDTDKAHRDLGWTPRYTGLEALRATIAGTDAAP